LCRTLLSDTDSVSLATEPTQTRAATGRPQLIWHVDCTDQTGVYLASFHWDARTGDLLYVGHMNSLPVRSTGSPAFAGQRQPLTEVQAQRKAAWLSYRWLHRLGIAGEGSHWRLWRAPQRVKQSDTWYVGWRSADHEAVVHVEVRSNILVSVHNWRLGAGQ